MDQLNSNSAAVIARVHNGPELIFPTEKCIIRFHIKLYISEPEFAGPLKWIHLQLRYSKEVEGQS